jgi:hypothetical protein
MTILFFRKIRSNTKAITFAETMAGEDHYTFEPTAFENGTT